MRFPAFLPPSLRSLPLLAIASLALASCATHRPPAKPVPRLIGSISLVNADLHFALIDSVSIPGPGTPLRALSQDGRETALLNVSPEQKQPFIIGNIVEGEPHTGDRVVDIPVVPAAATVAAPAAVKRPAAPVRVPRQK